MNPGFEIEGNASSEESTPNVYRDWELFRRIDRDLRDLAVRHELPLDDVPDGLKNEPRRLAQIERKNQVQSICREQARRTRIAKQARDLFRLNDQQLRQLEERYKTLSSEDPGDPAFFPGEPAWWATCSPEEHVQTLKDERMARDTETDEEKRTRWNGIQTELFPPDSWQELTVRVYCPGSSLEWYVRGRVRAYGSTQGLREVHRDDVVNAVMGHMYDFILRNAGTWHRRKQQLLDDQQKTPNGGTKTQNKIHLQKPAPKPGDSWWGYVQREADGRVRREADRRIADDARYRCDDQFDDQLEDRGTREKSWLSDFEPEQLKQGIANLPPDEHKVVLLRLAGKTFDEIGQELSISTKRVRELWVRALGRLRKWLQPASGNRTENRWTKDLKRWKQAADYRKKPWQSLLSGLRPEHQQIIDFVEQGRSPAEIALELEISPEEMDKLWYGIGTTLLRAIDRERL